MTGAFPGGIICTPHRLASEAGEGVLREGGTAIDAVLAAGAALSVCFPHMTGLGGDALLLINEGQRPRVIMGLGQAGQCRPRGDRITERGPASAATTAGALRAWALAKEISERQWSSTLDWARLLEPAIGLARTGTPVSQSQAFWQQQRRALLTSLPDLHRICHDDLGQLLAEGSRLRQPDLARTLEQLARAGINDFYEGDLAGQLAEGFGQMGNGLTLNDLKNTRATVGAPLRVRYRKGYLYNFPPPTQGLYTLSALAALNELPLDQVANGSADYYHFLVEAIKAQLVLRNRELADPACRPLPITRRLSEQGGRRQFHAILPDRAAPWRERGQPADTVWLAASDHRGRTACLMQSLFHDFGSGCFVGETGILWSNRAASFHPDPCHPNHWAPGKIPAHTLNPSCYIRDDGEQFYFGSQGGDGQPQTQMVLATQLIDYEQSLESALTAPRFLLGRSFFGSRDNLKLERTIPDNVVQALTARGHVTEQIPGLSPLTGQAGILCVRRNGRQEAMHDPRGEGTTAGPGLVHQI